MGHNSPLKSSNHHYLALEYIFHRAKLQMQRQTFGKTDILILWWEIFGFCLLSFCQNERFLSFLSLYPFWGKCVYFSIFEWWNSQLCCVWHNCAFYHSKLKNKHTFLKNIYKLRKLRNLWFWQNESRQKPDILHPSLFIEIFFLKIDVNF